MGSEDRIMTWLDNFISYQDRPEEYNRFAYLIDRWFHSLRVHDLAVIELDDLLEFIPTKGTGDDSCCVRSSIDNLAHDRGMTRVLWRRYIRPKFART